jgi:two-component system, OmpR family, sensor histidine kinase MtrB
MEHHQDPEHDLPATVRPSRSADPRLAMGTGESLPVLRDERGLSEDEVAQVAHHLRDPLARITLEAYLLDRKLANGDPSGGRQALAQIIRNVERLDRIVGDLLDSCAAGTGRLALRRRPTELRALTEQVIARIASAGDGGRVLLDAPFPITMSIDGLRIERVLANLIGNALEHSPRDSRIVVRLEAAALSARISVTDAGPELGPADLARVFDRYHRGTGALQRDGGGLGLYASKAIVEAHGGKLDVESVPGQGSRFYFDLPAIST